MRCEFIKHAELIEPGIIEFKCRSKHCGHGNGLVVIHRFDAMTGKMISTKRFKDPRGLVNGTSYDAHSIRDAAG